VPQADSGAEATPVMRLDSSARKGIEQNQSIPFQCLNNGVHSPLPPNESGASSCLGPCRDARRPPLGEDSSRKLLLASFSRELLGSLYAGKLAAILPGQYRGFCSGASDVFCMVPRAWWPQFLRPFRYEGSVGEPLAQIVI
jgi:hypothetical protein